MLTMLKALLGAVFGNVASGAAGGVAKAVEIGAIVAAVAPLALWFHNGGKDEILFAFTVSYGEAVALALLGLWIVRVLRRSPHPAATYPTFPPQ